MIRKPETEPREVRQEMNHLHKAVEVINISVNDLRTRIQPVLKISPPSAGTVSTGSTGGKDENLVPLATEIRAIGRMLLSYDSSIREIIENCEL